MSSSAISSEARVGFRGIGTSEVWGRGDARSAALRAVPRFIPRWALPSADAPHPWARRLFLVAVDAGILALGVWTGAVAASALGWGVALWPVGVAAALTLAGFAAGGLYGSFPLAPVEEFRTLGLVTLAAFGTVALATLEVGTDSALPLLVLIGTAVVVLSLVMSARATTRALFGASPWWGSPVVVLGDPAPADRVVQSLRSQPELGIRPVAVFHSRPAEGGDRSLPLSHAAHFATQNRIRNAIVVTAPDAIQGITERYGYLFDRLLVIPHRDSAASLWVGAREVAGTLGYEVRHRDHSLWRRVLKRAIDVGLSCALAVIAIPIGLGIALLIRIDSPGPVFYRQDRVGRGGRCFKVLKFRTMHVGAHRVLHDYLAANPAAAAEYATYAKLRDDPRVTRIGRVLRRTSLDELPQLLNVLRREMSLVGPRAYMPIELHRMNGRARTITRVTPGITGLWQVSGRNALSFDERVDLDRRYVRNWSISLDLYLLARTVPTVLFGRGAS